MHYFDDAGVWIASTAVVCGDVELGRETSVWHQVVIRGDVAAIRVGRRVNVQDFAMLHCRHGTPLHVGDDVVIGHHAIVHCRSVGDRTLIGINATMLDDAQIGADCMVAAGAVVVPGTSVPDGSVAMGTPARVVRATTAEDREMIARTVASYIELARAHAAGRFPAFGAT